MHVLDEDVKDEPGGGAGLRECPGHGPALAVCPLQRWQFGQGQGSWWAARLCELTLLAYCSRATTVSALKPSSSSAARSSKPTSVCTARMVLSAGTATGW